MVYRSLSWFPKGKQTKCSTVTKTLDKPCQRHPLSTHTSGPRYYPLRAKKEPYAVPLRDRVWAKESISFFKSLRGRSPLCLICWAEHHVSISLQNSAEKLPGDLDNLEPRRLGYSKRCPKQRLERASHCWPMKFAFFLGISTYIIQKRSCYENQGHFHFLEKTTCLALWP